MFLTQGQSFAFLSNQALYVPLLSDFLKTKCWRSKLQAGMFLARCSSATRSWKHELTVMNHIVSPCNESNQISTTDKTSQSLGWNVSRAGVFRLVCWDLLENQIAVHWRILVDLLTQISTTQRNHGVRKEKMKVTYRKTIFCSSKYAMAKETSLCVQSRERKRDGEGEGEREREGGGGGGEREREREGESLEIQ